MRSALRLLLVSLLATVAGTSLADEPAAGPRVTGTVARFYTGATTGWEGSLLVDPTGNVRRRPPKEGVDEVGCDRLSWNYGVTQGVELNYSAAHYTEATVAVALTNACEGFGFPLAGVSLGAGTRYRGGREYAGQQYTLALFSLPWPFLQFYARRVIDDARARFPGKAPAVQAGIMFKVPIPIWGYRWGDDEATSPAP